MSKFEIPKRYLIASHGQILLNIAEDIAIADPCPVYKNYLKLTKLTFDCNYICRVSFAISFIIGKCV